MSGRGFSCADQSLFPSPCHPDRGLQSDRGACPELAEGICGSTPSPIFPKSSYIMVMTCPSLKSSNLSNLNGSKRLTHMCAKWHTCVAVTGLMLAIYGCWSSPSISPGQRSVLGPTITTITSSGRDGSDENPNPAFPPAGNPAVMLERIAVVRPLNGFDLSTWACYLEVLHDESYTR